MAGKLEPSELIPPLIEMLGGFTDGGPPPTPEQCLGFAGMFDQVRGLDLFVTSMTSIESSFIHIRSSALHLSFTPRW